MKTETKHTPGPWAISRSGANSIKISAGNIPICQIDHWGQREPDLTASLKPEGQPEANAALIASAPDLLAQRDELLDLLEKLLALTEQHKDREWQAISARCADLREAQGGLSEQT